MEHFTVTVEVKQVIPPKAVMNDKGFPVKSLGGAEAVSERQVIDRLRVVVSAEDEDDAINRAIAMLTSARGAS